MAEQAQSKFFWRRLSILMQFLLNERKMCSTVISIKALDIIEFEIMRWMKSLFKLADTKLVQVISQVDFCV